MFDLSKEFKKFYDEEVVLPLIEKNKLREKKKLNLERLESGLKEYNEEHNTTYELVEVREQGSVAMSTVTQNDSNNYDIDVAIVFAVDNISGIGHREIKNIVVDALKRKCTNFKKEPEALKNCVRIEYNDGYHIDFAIYRKSTDEDGNEFYEHAGSTQWQERNPAAINDWFQQEINDKGNGLREVVRLSKMFCKSRSSWQMPGGLIQSVLCDEVYVHYDRIDERFYYTMCAIRDRLNSSIEVYNLADVSKSLLLKQKDRDEMVNWKNRLCDKIEKLAILFDEENCSKKKAKDAWNDFFQHDFWSTVNESAKCYSEIARVYYSNTEEFIQDMFPVDLQYSLELDCIIEADGFRPQRLIEFLRTYKWIPHNKKLSFSIRYTNAPIQYCDIYWKVRNVGAEAERRDCIRGQIRKTNLQQKRESADFFGHHFVECYLVRYGVVIAKGKIDVPIE